MSGIDGLGPQNGVEAFLEAWETGPEAPPPPADEPAQEASAARPAAASLHGARASARLSGQLLESLVQRKLDDAAGPTANAFADAGLPLFASEPDYPVHVRERADDERNVEKEADQVHDALDQTTYVSDDDVGEAMKIMDPLRIGKEFDQLIARMSRRDSGFNPAFSDLEVFVNEADGADWARFKTWVKDPRCSTEAKVEVVRALRKVGRHEDADEIARSEPSIHLAENVAKIKGELDEVNVDAGDLDNAMEALKDLPPKQLAAALGSLNKEEAEKLIGEAAEHGRLGELTRLVNEHAPGLREALTRAAIDVSLGLGDSEADEQRAISDAIFTMIEADPALVRSFSDERDLRRLGQALVAGMDESGSPAFDRLSALFDSGTLPSHVVPPLLWAIERGVQDAVHEIQTDLGGAALRGLSVELGAEGSGGNIGITWSAEALVGAITEKRAYKYRKLLENLQPAVQQYLNELGPDQRETFLRGTEDGRWGVVLKPPAENPDRP